MTQEKPNRDTTVLEMLLQLTIDEMRRFDPKIIDECEPIGYKLVMTRGRKSGTADYQILKLFCCRCPEGLKCSGCTMSDGKGGYLKEIKTVDYCFKLHEGFKTPAPTNSPAKKKDKRRSAGH